MEIESFFSSQLQGLCCVCASLLLVILHSCFGRDQWFEGAIFRHSQCQEVKITMLGSHTSALDVASDHLGSSSP